MKEIIEYLLAAFIVVSLIPIYNTIMYNYYQPPPKQVEPLTLYTFTEAIDDVMYSLVSSGNLTPEVVDIDSLIRARLGPNTLLHYGYNVTVDSSGIASIDMGLNTITIRCLDKGNLSVMILYENLSYMMVFEDRPTYTTNESFYYKISVPTTGIIAVSAILESGIVRYYAEWVSSSVYRMYIVNSNGRLALLIPSNYPEPSTYTYHGYSVVDTYIYYYTQQNYYNYSRLWYRYVKDAYYYVDWWGNPYEKILYVNESTVNYLSMENGQVTVNDRKYYEVTPSVFHYEEQYREVWRNYGGEWYLVSRRLVSSFMDVSDISFPIYNAVFIVLRDTNGRIYLASAYRHMFTVGEKPPANWPTRTISYYVRLGMIDYVVTVTVWRRSM